MAALLKKGWTWDQMMKARQAWGWFNIIQPESLSGYHDILNNPYYNEIYTYQGVDNDSPAKLWPFITLNFSSDAGTQDPVGLNEAIQGFQNLYHLPVQRNSSINFENAAGIGMGGRENKEYGQGLAGSGNIDRYLTPGSVYYDYTDQVMNVPDPPPKEAFSEEDAMRLRQLQDLQAQGEQLSQAEQNELLQLWMAQMQTMQVQSHFTKLATQNYKFVWADGIFEVAKGFYKDLHHYSLIENIVKKLGHAPSNYIAGDYTQDPFDTRFGSVKIRWYQGKVPSPQDLKDMMQKYIVTLPSVSAKLLQ